MDNRLFKLTAISTVWLWLGIFALVPIILVLMSSFLSYDINAIVKLPFTIQNYLQLINPIYLKVFIQSFYIAAICTLLCLILGYPFAYVIARSKHQYRALLLLLIIISFWTSSLIRSYAIMIMLKTHGIINSLLLWTGVIKQPLSILYTQSAVLLGLVYNLLPFMILPLYANIEKLDQNLIDAARDLGANWLKTFVKITLPLTVPGILAGVLLVFLPAMTLFYIPVLLGGSKNLLLGNLIQNQFLLVNNWPLGSSISIALLLVMSLLLALFWKSTQQKDRQELL